MYDARSIANWVLDQADQSGIAVSNLSINKIVYFLHAHYLAQFDRPLIGEKIEAWEYGPVIREIYSEFKSLGRANINFRAQRRSKTTLQREPVYEKLDPNDEAFLRTVLSTYLKLSAGRLVAVSHERNGPWDTVYNADARSNPGMEISNEIVRSYFMSQTRH